MLNGHLHLLPCPSIFKLKEIVPGHLIPQAVTFIKTLNKTGTCLKRRRTYVNHNSIIIESEACIRFVKGER